MAKHNEEHLTTEQLSAFLDQQLSLQEQTTCKLHLQTCEHCQSTLATLQQTVALLKALPAPSLPRSFVLPAGVNYLQEQANERQLSSATTNSAPSRKLWLYYMQRSLRAASTIAAVIGLVFLLSGVLPTLHLAGSTSTSSSNATVPSAARNAGSTEPNTASTYDRAHSATSQKTVAANQPNGTGIYTPATSLKGATPTPIAGNFKRDRSSTSQEQPSLSLPDLDTAIGRQEVGWSLMVLGIGGVLLTRRKKLPAS